MKLLCSAFLFMGSLMLSSPVQGKSIQPTIQKNDGSITDATGQYSSSISRSALSCLTAWDYKENTTTCRQDLNKDIRDGVADNAAADIKVRLVMADDSILVIDALIDQDVVGIRLNEKASATTNGDTFEQAAASGAPRFYSIEEANSVAHGTAMPIYCLPSDAAAMRTWDMVKTVSTYLPDGTERKTFVYEKQNYYIVRKECN